MKNSKHLQSEEYDETHASISSNINSWPGPLYLYLIYPPPATLSWSKPSQTIF